MIQDETPSKSVQPDPVMVSSQSLHHPVAGGVPNGHQQQAQASGWGPMVDQTEDIVEILDNDNLNFNKDEKNGALPDKKGFLYLSQHVITENFDPATSSGKEHKELMKTKQQEIVTFIQLCNCTKSCVYACVRLV